MKLHVEATTKSKDKPKITSFINMDSYSCTTNNIIKFSHTWEIKNYDLSENCNEIIGLKSKEFAASDNSNNTFRMKLARWLNTTFAVCLEESSDNNDIKYKYDLCASFETSAYCSSSLATLRFNSCTNLLVIKDVFGGPYQISPHATLKIRCVISTAPTDLVNIIENIFPVPRDEVHNDIKALHNSKEFADVTIETKDDKTIPAHKTILSARSKVFAAMFKVQGQQNCISISAFKYEVVLEMLRFIYTGCAPNLKDMTEELLSAAEKYDLKILKAMCLNDLHANLCVETAAATLKLADLYQEDKLKSKVIQYIKDNNESVLKTPDWKSLAKTDKILILESFCALKLNDE